MSLGAVHDCQQAFAEAQHAAGRIEHSYGQAKPLAGPSTWQGKDAHHWMTDWNHRMNRLMRLLDSLGQQERAAVRHAQAAEHGHSGAHA